MSITKWGAFLPLFLSLTGCHNLMMINDQCEPKIRAYNRMVRWQEYELAENAVAPDIKAEYRHRLLNKDLQITDYRIKNLRCDGAKGEAEVVLEYDYLISPATKMKTVESLQKWRYSPEAFPDGWRVVTPPPDFAK